MLEAKNVDIMISTHYLIKGLSLTLNKGDKLAIIGEEGNGKSTLLKSLLGVCDYATIKGNLDFKGNRIGYLEQSLSEENLQKKVYDFLFKDDEDYYNKINKFYKYLEILNIRDDLLEQEMSTLSGGERVKISILNLLLEEYDILFLDEPTNDLDIDTLKWLEQFINGENMPIVYVSHDETLLANTANMILHIEQVKKKQECRHTLLKIGYDEYVENRLRAIDKQTQIAKSEKREFNKKQERLREIMQSVEHEQNTISRADPHGARLLKKKMKSLKSQEARLDKTELTEIPAVEESINFAFEEVDIPKSKGIIELNIPKLKIGEKNLAQNIELAIVGNTHLCIIGKNGVGKSTLIKLIYENLRNRTDINLGYMPQDYGDILNNYEYVLEFLADKNQDNITKARMYLGNMNFTREEMTSKISRLSNGTKAKLFLIKLVLEKCNVLLLDEPTRNVSPLSNPVIRRVLRDFNGTIISVSHDRKYLKEVIDEVYELTENGLSKINYLD